MIIYNVTIKIDRAAHQQWLKWMLEVHVPEVMATGFFTKNTVCKLKEKEDEDGFTYAFMYYCESQKKLNTYMQKHAPALQRDHDSRFSEKYVAFRTQLEVIA